MSTLTARGHLDGLRLEPGAATYDRLALPCRRPRLRGRRHRPVLDLRVARHPARARRRGAAQLRRRRHSLIWTWFAVAWTYGVIAVPMLLLPAALGRKDDVVLRAATAIGATSVVLSVAGFLRWVFVVPALARDYVAGDDTAREAVAAAWMAQHQYGGVLLGEHLGELLAIAWSVTVAVVVLRTRVLPAWVGVSGLVVSVLYFLNQGDIMATAIPDFPVWDLAGADREHCVGAVGGRPRSRAPAPSRQALTRPRKTAKPRRPAPGLRHQHSRTDETRCRAGRRRSFWRGSRSRPVSSVSAERLVEDLWASTTTEVRRNTLQSKVRDAPARPRAGVRRQPRRWLRTRGRGGPCRRPRGPAGGRATAARLREGGEPEQAAELCGSALRLFGGTPLQVAGDAEWASVPPHPCRGGPHHPARGPVLGAARAGWRRAA